MNKNRKMTKKILRLWTVDESWLILGIGLKYFSLYAVPVKGAQTLPPCTYSNQEKLLVIFHLATANLAKPSQSSQVNAS